MTIDEDKLRAAFSDLATRVAYLERATGLFASDKDMAGPKADPTVRFEPRSWKGPEQKGKRFSECLPEFLEQLAEALAWGADNPKDDEARKYAAGNRADARRARTWARRIRAKATPAAESNQAATPATSRPHGRPNGRPSSTLPGRVPTPPSQPDDDDFLNPNGNGDPIDE
jgi:hypothetical protein